MTPDRLADLLAERSRVASPDEVKALLQVASVDLQRVILAGWACGMRRGEMVGARWEWVNRVTRELHLPAEITKTGRARRVFIPDQLWHLLQVEPRHEVWVFARGRGRLNGKGARVPEQWSVTALQRAWARARKTGSSHKTPTIPHRC